jgi:glycosyltransferase involved in cell wall biosynthesis
MGDDVINQFVKDGKIVDQEGLEKCEIDAFIKFMDRYKLPYGNDKKNVLFIAGDITGCGYVRCFVPSQMMQKYSKKYNAITSVTVPIELIKWADIIVWQRQHQKKLIKFLESAKYAGKLQIFEIDDNLHKIPMLNVASRIYNPNTEPYKYMLGWMKHCDHLMVSTERLKEFYGGILQVPCTVIPNHVKVVETPKEHFVGDRVRILWAGTSTHAEDLTLLIEPFKKLKDKYGDKIKICTMGWDGKVMMEADMEKVPEETKKNLKDGEKVMQVIDLNLKTDKFIPGVPVDQYLDKLCGMNFDIGLCPLIDNEFNRSKSNIKWLEYSMAGMATIASDINPYQCINNNVDGIIVQDKSKWFETIDTLIQDRNTIRRLAKAARDRVISEFNSDNVWMKYEALFDRLLAEKSKA